MGICGTAVYEKENVKGIKDISCINIRIPRNINGVSEPIIKEILQYELNKDSRSILNMIEKNYVIAFKDDKVVFAEALIAD